MFKRTVKIIIIGISVYLYGAYNIYNYSVYYAKHMPYGEDRDLMIMEFIDNLWWQSEPTVEHLEYDMDGNSAIKTKIKSVPYISNLYDKNNTYIYRVRSGKSYHFDYKFKLKYTFEESKKSSLEGVDEYQIKQDIYNFIQPILDNHSEPIINLQLLYNLINQDRINYMTNKLSE